MAYKYFIKGVRKFNDEKVAEKAKTLFLSEDEDYNLLARRKTGKNGEVDSITVLIDEWSTQGVRISYRIDGLIEVELPWLASIMDVRYCFAYLQAAKKVHRSARFVDENGKDVKITNEEARQQWFVRCDNMSEIIEKGEGLTVKGWFRDFYIHPDRYDKESSIEDKVYKAFDEFTHLQWLTLGFDELPEENRHISEEEELSSIRVLDNTKQCFIEDCSYIGLMQDNTCKMVRLLDFYEQMEGNENFIRMDYKQALLNPLPNDQWEQVFEKAEGIVIENYRKTFIMRWNTDISGYTMEDLEDSIENFYEEGFYYDWSIWDYKKVHIGDNFFMVRTGNGVNGIVMKGTFTGMPYVDEDWSGRGRKVYYIRMSLTHLIHPDKCSSVLTTEELSGAIPGFNWQDGHSGELLTDCQASKLEQIWNAYLCRAHDFQEKNRGVVETFIEKGKQTVVNENRFEIRCHEWGDDSDYNWSWSNTLQGALDCLKQFREKDPDNIYENLYIIEHHKDGTLSIPEYDRDTFEII